MDAGDTLSASHKTQERRSPRRSHCRIRIIKEARSCAVQKNGVILLEVFGVDIRSVVTDSRGPQTTLVSQRFDRLRRQWDGRMHKPARAGMRQHQHPARVQRFRSGGRGKAAIMASTAACGAGNGVELPTGLKVPDCPGLTAGGGGSTLLIPAKI